jgi:hypothetical protein
VCVCVCVERMTNSERMTSQQAISTSQITYQPQVDAAVDRAAEHPQASFSLNMRSKDAEQGRETYAVSSWLSEDVEQRRETCAVSSSRSEANARGGGGGGGGRGGGRGGGDALVRLNALRQEMSSLRETAETARL